MNDKQFCFVAQDKLIKTMHADLADVKGDGDAQVAKGLKKFITSTGHKKSELKTDGEPALLEVARKAKKLSEAEVILRNPPA